MTRHPDFSRLDTAVKQFILTHRASQGGVLIASLLGKSRLVEVNLFLGEQVSVREVCYRWNKLENPPYGVLYGCGPMGWTEAEVG